MNVLNAEHPETVDEPVALTGAETADYMDKMRYCGGPVLPVNEETALSAAKEKLQDIAKAGADEMCLVCLFCSVMYDSN